MEENNKNQENLENNQPAAENKPKTDDNFKWYILNVMAGQENKIANEIKSLMQGVLKKTVVEAVIPCQEVTKVKRGKKVQESQKLFPGYVFVKANINSDAFNTLNSIPKVLSFLGGKNTPQEVSEAKMQEILSSVAKKEEAGSNAIYEIGETLNVIEGPFESFSGVVEEFDAEKKKVKITISIFGRATSVELELNQVEKV